MLYSGHATYITRCQSSRARFTIHTPTHTHTHITSKFWSPRDHEPASQHLRTASLTNKVLRSPIHSCPGDVLAIPVERDAAWESSATCSTHPPPPLVVPHPREDGPPPAPGERLPSDGPQPPLGGPHHHRTRTFERRRTDARSCKTVLPSRSKVMRRYASPCSKCSLEINTCPKLFGQWPVDCIFWGKILCFPPFFERNPKKNSTIFPTSCLFLPTRSPNDS